MERQNSITLLAITNFLRSGALLRHQDKWLLIEGPFRPTEAPSAHGISVFCPDFYDLDGASYWQGVALYELSSDSLREALALYLKENHGRTHEEMTWEEPLRSDFEESFARIQALIKEGAIAKAVPVVFSRATCLLKELQRAQMMMRLLAASSNLFVYGFWSEQKGVLGATPEVLFRYTEGVLKTMALAGTCPKSEETLRDSLLRDPKERHEHDLVVRDLMQVLESEGVMTLSGPSILELPTLYHLKTDIELRVQTKPDFAKLIQRLHPTPALGVAPRQAGYHWMSDLPGQKGRGPFGAPFAILGPEEALCLVGIRNIQWNGASAQIGSGCGVVAASECEREWRELFQKRLSVKKILGIEL